MFHVVCGSSKPCHRNRKIPALLLFKNYLSTKFFLATGYSLSYQHNILLINPIYDNRLLVELQYVQYVLFYITIVVCCYNCLYLSLENEQRIMEKNFKDGKISTIVATDCFSKFSCRLLNPKYFFDRDARRSGPRNHFHGFVTLVQICYKLMET